MAAAGLAVVGGRVGAARRVLERRWAHAGARRGDRRTTATLTFQLSWIKNVEFAGEYIADTKGYYKKQGFSSVNLMSGGPTVQQDAVVQSGKAFVVHLGARHHVARPSTRAPTSIIIGAQYQKNPFAVMSLAKKPDQRPRRT